MESSTGLKVSYKYAVLFDPFKYPEKRAEFIQYVVVIDQILLFKCLNQLIMHLLG
jgi:hypothetical protein